MRVLYVCLMVLAFSSGNAWAICAGENWWQCILEQDRTRAHRPPQTSPSDFAKVYEIPDPVYDERREPMPMQIALKGNLIIIFTRYQQYAAYIDGKRAKYGDMLLSGPVSTGGRRDATPLTDPRLGPEKIADKHERYRSKTYPEPYGGAPMPHSIFFGDRTRGIALHAGSIPQWQGQGYGLSRGCVRLPSLHAEILFKHFSDESVRVIVVEDVQALRDKWERPVLSAQ